MNRVYNIPRRLTDNRRFSVDGKMAIAAWLGIKFAFGNSTLYNISIENLMSFFHLRRDRAKRLLKLMWEDSELFYINKKKNCVFAKSCRNKLIKVSRRGDKYCGDDVMTIDVPECYLRDKKHKESLALSELVRLFEHLIVCKEYDNHAGYKYSTGDLEGCIDHCETPVEKTQLYIAKRTGLNRSKVGRILREYLKQGLMSKTECHIERCHKGDRYSFKALHKETRMPYWAKCVPPVFSWISDMPFKFRYIIWNAKKRTRSKFTKSSERIRKDIMLTSGNCVSQAEIDFHIMVERNLEMRAMYD